MQLIYIHAKIGNWNTLTADEQFETYIKNNKKKNNNNNNTHTNTHTRTHARTHAANKNQNNNNFETNKNHLDTGKTDDNKSDVL